MSDTPERKGQGKQLIFVSSAIQHPRHQKRIAQLGRGFSVFVVYNERSQYLSNRNNFQHPVEQTANLGHVENRRYHKRIGVFVRMLRVLKQRPESIAYCTSMESVVASLLAGKQTILELGDLHQYGRFAALYRLIDRILVPRLALIVLTSPQFRDKYYSVHFPRQLSRVRVVENRLPSQMAGEISQYRQAYRPQAADSGRVRLGLIGSIRFRSMLIGLRDFISQRDDLELHIFGDGEVDVFDDCERCVYHGTYMNPEDLRSIYSQIDITVILYDNTDLNVRWALPNKLYESLAFLKPILCSDNCGLAELVEENSYGVSSSIANLPESVDRLVRAYPEYQQNLKELPEAAYLDLDSEVSELVQASCR